MEPAGCYGMNKSPVRSTLNCRASGAFSQSKKKAVDLGRSRVSAEAAREAPGYGDKKFPPQTSAAPRCPATATRVAAPKSALRYRSTDRRDSTCQESDAVA